MYSNLNINQDPFAKPENSALAQHEAAAVCEPQIARLDYPRLLQLAWAAGMFDGDGCVIISNTLQPGRKNRTTVMMSTPIEIAPHYTMSVH